MEYSPVAPIDLLLKLAKTTPELIGNYFLFLAHDVILQPSKYQELIEVVVDYNRSKFIIGEITVVMDNSLIELGEPVSGRVMYEAMKFTKSNYIVLPDHLGDAEKTRIASTRALQEWSDMGMKSFMVVPQGQTIEEWLNCLHYLMGEGEKYSYNPITLIGIPKVASDTIGSRYQIAKIVASLYPKLKIHLLGFAEDYMQDVVDCASIRQSNFCDRVLGIDSAVPLRATQLMTYANAKDIGPRSDWWEQWESQNKEELEAMKIPKIVKENLKFVRSWIR